MNRPVDVLAVLDRNIAADAADSSPEWIEEMRAARAAVAELIEADKEYDEALRLANIGYGSDHEDRAAQQRLRESIAARRNALARVHPMTREQQAEQAGVRG